MNARLTAAGRLALPGFLLALSALWLAQPARAEGPEASARLTPRDKLYDVRFVDGEAWVVGYPGLVLHSSDAGRTFRAQESGTREALFAIDMLNAREGYIAGRSGLILKTGDGGAHWTPLPVGQVCHNSRCYPRCLNASGCPAKSACTAGVCGATTREAVCKRDDDCFKGGHEPLFALDFIDAQNGWAVGNFGTIVRTRDGGTSWQSLSLGPDEDASLNAVCFVSANEGWVAGEFGTIAHTTDGGDTWERQDSPASEPLFELLCKPGGPLLAAGAQGVVVTSSDGGATWSQLATEQSGHIFGLFAHEQHLWAVGSRGLIIERQADRFVRAPLRLYQWLSALAFAADGQRGLLVGGRATLLFTADGGRSFQPAELR